MSFLIPQLESILIVRLHYNLQGLELILSSSPHLAKTRFKKNNQITWSIIEEIINTNYLEVIGIKVKGHDKDPERLPYNDKADSLAKSGAELIHFNITTSSYRSSVFKYIPCFDGERIERNIRHFIKNCYQAYIHYELTSLNRFTDLLPLFTSATIDWTATWKALNTSPSFSHITSFKFSPFFSFTLKLFINELPTLSKLKACNLMVYDSTWSCYG